MHLIRKLVLVSAALALPVAWAVTAVAPGPAGAVTPPVAPGTNYCSTVTGTVTFNPAMTLNGSSSVTTETATIAATATKCKVSKGVAPTKGTTTAKIVTKGPKANACTGLATSRPVALGVAWTHTPAIANSTVSFPGYTVVQNKAGDEGFSLPKSGQKSTVTGSYPGTDSGHTSTALVYTTKTESQLAAACATGLKSLTIGGGAVYLR